MINKSKGPEISQMRKSLIQWLGDISNKELNFLRDKYIIKKNMFERKVETHTLKFFIDNVIFIIRLFLSNSCDCHATAS